MTGQSAMFGNVANFAGSIGPEGRPGSFASGPVYDPASFTMPPPMYDVFGQNLGPRALGTGLAAAQAAMPVAALAGSFLPGAAGRAFSMMDPTYAGMSGFARGAGLLSGVGPGSGLFGTAEGMLANAGRIASGGFGNIARAGIAGIGAGMASFLPAYAATQAVAYGAGQMLEGAQHTSHVQDFLQRQVRFTNPASRSGFGFSRSESADIASSIRDLASKDTLTTTKELTSIMEQGVQGGLFKAVQDAQAFKQKFKELKDTLRVVATAMNTTLSGAMPFLAEARKMGFWTPGDVMAAASLTRGAATQTGLSVADTQAAMGTGAAMARSVGAQGMHGALGMQRTLSLIGGGLRSGVISERTLQDATGLQGPEAARAFGETMQAGATRFASSRTGRWLLAAMANKDFTGFDKDKLAGFMSGHMRVGDIQRMASQNTSGRGNAAAFLMGEEDLRGELLSQGPMAQTAFIRGALGDKLHGTSSMDKYVTRRMIQRFLGVNAKTADIFADLARKQPQIIRENAERELSQREAENAQNEMMLNHSFGGAMRKMGHWLYEGTGLRNLGASISQGISSSWTNAMDRFWGRPVEGSRVSGITTGITSGLRGDILGGRKSAFGPSRSRDELDREMSGFEEQLGKLGAVGSTSGFSPGLMDMMGVQAFGGGGGSSKRVDLRTLQGLPKFKELAQQLAAGNIAGAEAIRKELAKEGLSPGQQESLDRIIGIAQEGGKGAEKLKEVMKGVSSNIGAQEGTAFSETMKGRMTNALGALGGAENAEKTFGLADELKSGGKGLGIGGILKGLLTKDFDPDSRRAAMEKLASSVSAGGSDVANKLLAMLPNTNEFQAIRAVIDGSQDSGTTYKEGWGKGRGLQHVNRLVQELGAGGLSGKDYKTLVGKDKKASGELIERMLSGLDSDRAGAVKGLLTALQQGGDAATSGVRGTQNKLAALLGMGADGRLANAKSSLNTAELANQMGGRGSMSGIHDTLTRMLNVQEAFYASEQGGKFQYQPPTEKPPGAA